MESRHVALEVVAPAPYYQSYNDLAQSLARMREFLGEFDVGSRIDGLTMSLNTLAFPENFDQLPFENGEAVKQKCDTERLTIEGSKIRDAFKRLDSIV